MQSRINASVVAPLLFALSACASDDGVQGDRALYALEASELNAAELGFNEDSCADESADAPQAEASSTSGGGYDHPGCPHQYLVTRKLARTRDLVIGATYAGGIGGDFMCSGSWTQVAIWKRPAKSARAAWTRVGQSPMMLGADGPATDGAGAACRATALVHVPDDAQPAEYLVVAQAGWTMTFQPVLVAFNQ